MRRPINPLENIDLFNIYSIWKEKKYLIIYVLKRSLTLSHTSPFVELSAIFISFEIVVCKLFQFGKVENLSFGKGLFNSLLNHTGF